MAALTSVSITTAGATPAPAAVSASDTIARTQFGPNGCLMRVINAGGTIDNVSVADPNLTLLGNAGTVVPVAVPITTGIRMIYIPLAACSNSTDLATVTHSFTTTVTCELYRV
jgi:hypothetical protein